jgi:ELWxxDGT repeat protein
VKDILPGTSGSLPQNLTNVGGVLYFSADNGLIGEELWRSDGTEAGTTLVKNVLDGTFGHIGSAPKNFTNVGGMLYFSASETNSGIELWKSDGTTAGTVRVRDIFPGQTPSNPSSLTNVLGTLYFGATTAARGFQLWKSDGTDAGTVAVEDFEAAIGWQSPGPIVTTNDRAFVLANTDSYGQEIWVASLFDPGDYNRDGQVTPTDHAFWSTHFGATTGLGLQADGNRDGVVDAADYNIWRENFTPPTPAAAAASPASITPPVARDLAPPLPKRAVPLASSPPRRTDLLLAARDSAAREWAFAEMGSDALPSPSTTYNSRALKFAAPKTTVNPKL